MLGQALMVEGRRRGHTMQGAARSGADYDFDVSSDHTLRACLTYAKAEIVINAAAMTDLAACELNPGRAVLTNSRPVAVIAKLLAETAPATRLIQISTDHFWTTPYRHREADPVALVNTYARSKYLGEELARTHNNSLSVRTNLVGFRGCGKPTFAEWACDAIETDAPITLFDDFFTSPIDVWAFSRILMEVIETQPELCGLLNLAGGEVAGKREIILRLASAMGKTLTRAKTGSAKRLYPTRALHCGLDVSRAEQILGRRLPTLDEVIEALAERRTPWRYLNPSPSTGG